MGEFLFDAALGARGTPRITTAQHQVVPANQARHELQGGSDAQDSAREKWDIRSINDSCYMTPFPRLLFI